MRPASDAPLTEVAPIGGDVSLVRELEALVTYDARMAQAAAAMGLLIERP